MELIAKAANQGKTSEAIVIAASMEGSTFFVSSEMRSEQIVKRLGEHKLQGKVIASNLTSAESVRVALVGWAVRGVVFDTVVLDVNFGITHQEWFKLAQELEDHGVYVVVTQQLVRHGVNSKETLIAKRG